ncbi:uncharacterized protein B0P05DRAFT_536811 [Gilbertella persicaria]|uniref:uncharacterized protein n=1 Tax=Gilbertella persicaria TaxID=101096 RepID=UPI0022208412|nr:uncharacterized protein B0P05DRAFT_536811 [Gilbertella persicaria]KAI8083291.1 hypothetical protein B0P05DRAFT_536811 [Gilbertella persicaria]
MFAASNAISTLCHQVKQAYLGQNAQLYAQLLSIDLNNPTINSLLSELAQKTDAQLELNVNDVLEDTSIALSDAVLGYLKVLKMIHSPDIEQVFETYASYYSALIPVFSSADTYYQVPLIKNLSSSLVQLAFQVDRIGLRGKARKANTAARLLSKVFNIMLADRSPIETSKRQGIFHITNLAFKVYFKLNSIRMCQTFINNIRSGEIDLSLYPISQQVTYKYYIGRYALYHGRLKQAQECLLFAFQKCHPDQWHNKRMILHYLIPTRIILGYFPKHALLETYNLVNPYLNLIQCLKVGNIQGYLDHLEIHFNYFYHHLTYVLLKERGIVLVWRCLIRNMYTQLGSTVPIIHFDHILAAIQFATQSDYALEDIECMLVSLVSQGYMRGYLQHQKQRIVLSKVNAFPPISSVRLVVERYNESLIDEHLDQEPHPLPQEIKHIME